ncbi:MAG TPA: PIG-L family deacetylase [Patescibacteria group bacterium]|nr:PIG-L family deacetylase [Patescibacteria group bacterium]
MTPFNHFKAFLKGSLKLAHRYRKFLVFVAILYAFWFFGLGMLGGYLLNKGSLSDLPDITSNDKILIISPHIDDEIIATGGVIQEAVSKGAAVKVVYMTNGDDAVGAIISEKRNLNLDPNEFVALGEQRMAEGKKATNDLGLTDDNLIYLGFPDGGLNPMLTTYYRAAYTSKATRFNYSPYTGTYIPKQQHLGINVVNDLKEIIKNFEPNIIFVSHLRDRHPDHSASYQFLVKSLIGQENNPKVYSYLVHYSLYPAQKKLLQNSFMYPPNRLFSKEGWYSFDLTNVQQDRKLKAIDENTSQIKTISMLNFLKSFVRRNEIFEVMN